jgi:hypothetical protein
MKALHADMKSEFKDVRNTQKADFLWTLAAISGLFALMAHGFHWF